MKVRIRKKNKELDYIGKVSGVPFYEYGNLDTDGLPQWFYYVIFGAKEYIDMRKNGSMD